MPRNGSGVYTQPYPDVVAGTTIESAKYNGNVDDVEQDLNTPRPVVAGGTGSNNARDAMTTLHGDLAYQVVNNYDSFAFVSGSFYSPAGATGAPVAGHAFTGICYTSDPAVVAPALPASNNLVIEARDETEALNPGRKWVREKRAGVWSPWTLDGRTNYGYIGGGGYEGISGVAADMFYGVTGLAPNAAFVVNSKADATGTNILSVSQANSNVGVTAKPADNASFSLNSFAATAANIIYSYKNNKTRWSISLGDGTAESGSNSGSDLYVSRYADDGTYLGSVIAAQRSSGNVTVLKDLTVAGGGTSGSVWFGNTASKVINYDGANFQLSGGAWCCNSSVYAGFGSAKSGYYFFGNDGTNHLACNGTNIYIQGLPLLINGNATIGNAGTTATFYFGNTATKYLAYDGSNFTLNGGQLVVNSNIYASGGSFVSALSATSGTYYFGNAGTKSITYDGANFVVTGGPLYVGANIVATVAAAPATGYTYYGNASNKFVGTDGTYLYLGSNGATLHTHPALYLGYSGITANLYFGNTGTKYLSSDGTSITITGNVYIAGTGNLIANTQGYKPGGGSWADSSDARIKNELGEYTRGLAEIVGLRPVYYTYKGNDTPAEPAHLKTGEEEKDAINAALPLTVPYPNSAHKLVAESATKYAGLIAQEVEAIFPEMVTRRSAYIDGQPVDDMRELDTTPLIFALVNAVKELKAEVDALKAAR